MGATLWFSVLDTWFSVLCTLVKCGCHTNKVWVPHYGLVCLTHLVVRCISHTCYGVCIETCSTHHIWCSVRMKLFTVWGCILKSSMQSSYLSFLVFAVLLSLHHVTYLMFFITCVFIFLVDNRKEELEQNQ